MTTSAKRGRAERLFDVIDTILLAVGNTALLVLLVVICWTVIARYVLRTPASWGEDITSIAFAWFIFIAMVPIHNRRGHIGLDIVVSRLPQRAQDAINKAVDLFILVFCAYSAWLCGLQAVISYGTAHTTVLKIPLSFSFASLTIGFGLMGLRSLGYALGARPIPMPSSVEQV